MSRSYDRADLALYFFKEGGWSDKRFEGVGALQRGSMRFGLVVWFRNELSEQQRKKLPETYYGLEMDYRIFDQA